MGDYKWRNKRSSDSIEDDSIIRKIMEKLILSDEFVNKIYEKASAKLMAILQQETKLLQRKVEQLQTQLAEMNEKMDNLEQYSKINNLRFYGIPERPNEDTDQLIVDFCRDKMNIVVRSQDINAAYRLKHAENGLKPIIVKFTNRTIKREIYSNKIKLKGTRTVIKEDLTSKRATIFKELGNIVPKKCTWTNNGKIFYKVDNKIRICRSVDDVKRISNQPIPNTNGPTC
ncbi:hypothetical protein Trydic_g9476 [Trypoxylus dichotomus]